MRVVLLIVAAALARGETPPDPQRVLEQARVRLQALARGLEEYVCVETVDRSYYERIVPRKGAAAGDARRLESTDRVRFEVTVSHGRELHSWPGARGFDVRDVDELVRDGPVSTGAFGAYLASVFDRPGVTFQYIGPQSADGKTVFEYRYHVPLEASRLEIKVATGWHPAAYEGEFRLDPQSLELERLTVRTGKLPPGAAFCEAAATLNYQRVHIDNSDILLPRQSQLDVVLGSGRETRNVTTFASCREYGAESEMVFDAPSDAGSTFIQSGGRGGRIALPIGLPVTLALSGPIDTATAAAGDTVAAKVVKSVRRPGSAGEVIPAGAIVHGRIRRVEHHLLPAPYFLVALAFNRVEVGGVLSPFAARSEPSAELAKQLEANLEIRATGIWFWGVGTFLFSTDKSHIVIPAGFESKWFTLATGGR